MLIDKLSKNLEIYEDFFRNQYIAKINCLEDDARKILNYFFEKNYNCDYRKLDKKNGYINIYSREDVSERQFVERFNKDYYSMFKRVH